MSDDSSFDVTLDSRNRLLVGGKATSKQYRVTFAEDGSGSFIAEPLMTVRVNPEAHVHTGYNRPAKSKVELAAERSRAGVGGYSDLPIPTESKPAPKEPPQAGRPTMDLLSDPKSPGVTPRFKK